ncbi:MAG: hypothetical protein ACFE0O_12270 [Opitutales bacterium]
MSRVLIYQLIHLSGVLMVFLSFGALIARAWLQPENIKLRKFGGIVSGIGLFLILLGGFGLLARVYGNEWYPWVIVKLVVWLLLGAMLAFINRKPQLAPVWFWTTLVLGFVSVSMVYIKPGM